MARSARTFRARVLTSLLIPLLGACSGATGPEREIQGKVLYEQYCARCHGLDGIPVQGVDPVCDGAPGTVGCPPNFQDRAWMDRLSDREFEGAVRGGKQPAKRPQGVAPGKGMPAFPQEFTEATLMVVIAYVRGLSGSRGPHAPEG